MFGKAFSFTCVSLELSLLCVCCRRVDYMFESLEEFHVFVLAEVLKRPIIIFADSVMRDVEGNPLSPVPFGGTLYCC